MSKYSWSIKVDGKVIKSGFESIYPALAYIEEAIEKDLISYSEKDDCSGYALDADSIEFVKNA